MIVRTGEVNSTWKPKTMKITFETEKEFTEFKEMIRHCDTVPDSIIAYGSVLDRDFVCDFMSKIYNSI